MTKIRIATWNINSLRLRFDQVKKVLIEQQIDIIALQETKVRDEYFPLKQCKAIGYHYIYYRGEKSYNGVALLSRIKLEIGESLSLFNADARHISVVVNGEFELHNFYVPAGGDIPDQALNPKYNHKLKYLDAMQEWFAKNRKANDKMILVGDLNIAPFEHDVWSHKQLLNVVSHTKPEIDRLNSLRDDLGWVDISRKFTPLDVKLYSWWSYRNIDWKKSNRGRRLDHIWTSLSVADKITSTDILSYTRDFDQPSDHVPVVIELKII
jgi:exodeoxyribonuclease-3